MSEVIMENVREKLSNAREKCPGMSDEIYALTDYMSARANDKIVPIGMGIFLMCVMDDIEKGRNGFGNEEFPEYLNKNKNIVLSQAMYFPQVIDAIAEQDFSEEFRGICKEMLNIDPPKRVNADIDEKYPEYVKVAVNWWANAIMSPKFDNGEINSQMLMLMRFTANSTQKFTEEDIKLFKDTLAEAVYKHVEEFGRCDLVVDYEPCQILASVGDTIDLFKFATYPWKTSMLVTKERIVVKYGYSSVLKKIWSND